MGKGGDFEREVCKELSLWWTDGERNDIFWRTPGSGARATTRKKQGLKTADSAGDMLSMHESGKPLTKQCLFEFKRGYGGIRKRKTRGKPSEELSILSIIDNPQWMKTEPKLLVIWEKAEAERKAHGLLFTIIIFKRDRKARIICVNDETFRFMLFKNGNYVRPPVATVLVDKFTIHLMRFDDWLKWCRPETFKKRILKRRKNVSRVNRKKG